MACGWGDGLKGVLWRGLWLEGYIVEGVKA